MIMIFDSGYRGPCPPESAEQITAINLIRKRCPVVVHPRNEGKRTLHQAAMEKAEGLTTGASDIIIPGCPAFVCELKRKDSTKSRLTKEQKKYLTECDKLGAFCCVAYGHAQAMRAFEQWLDLQNNSNNS